MAAKVETSTPPNTPIPIGPYNHIAKVGQFITIGGTELKLAAIERSHAILPSTAASAFSSCGRWRLGSTPNFNSNTAVLASALGS